MEKSQIRTSAEILLIVVLMVSLGVNYNDKDEGYIPYSCDKETVPDYMCYKLSRVNDNGIQRNCYYNRDKSRSYKVCSTGWKKIIDIDEYSLGCPDYQPDECPVYDVCEDTICEEKECSTYEPCPTQEPCVQTCKGCGSGGGGGSCSPCPEVSETECNPTRIIAFTDNGKYVCPGFAPDVQCIHEGDLSQKKLDELGW